MENIEKDLQHGLYVDCLTKQLEEINLLSSIYCNSGELKIHDPSVISDFNEYIDGILSLLQSKLDFSIFIVNPLESSEKIEIRIILPHLYPSIENAKISIRNSSFTKFQENYVNKKIDEFIDEIDKSETYIYQVCMWIQDNLDEFLKTSSSSSSVTRSMPSTSSSSLSLEKEIFERLWIYSHHIKSKTKRQEIIRQAKILQLTGFCRPGKPGIICVEGLRENTQEFWQTIKSMRWQKITVKKIETKQKPSMGTEAEMTTASSSSSSLAFDLNRYRRFQQFKEIIVDEESAEGKMDLSLFMKFLESHNCGYMKKELFGYD